MVKPGDNSPIQESTDPTRAGPLRLREYQLLEKLGAGGMGTVYRALHLRLERVFAVKTLSSERTQDHEAIGRFQREMKAVGALDHANIIRATDAGEVNGIHFLVTEFVDGVDLSQLIYRVGPLPIGAACETIRQAAEALQHVHEHGLVHRDIKPANLMVASDGQVKILDLGLALLQTQRGDAATSTGQIVGTVDYMSPEQAIDTQGVDIRSDIYSLGCTLFYLLAGKPPFAGDSYRTTDQKLKAHAEFAPPRLSECRSDVPARVEAVVQRMMAKDPADRFRSPAEVVEHLQGFADGRLGDLLAPVSAQPANLRSHDTETRRPFSAPIQTITAPPLPTTSEGDLSRQPSRPNSGRGLSWATNSLPNSLPNSLAIRLAISLAISLAIAGGLAGALYLNSGERQLKKTPPVEQNLIVASREPRSPSAPELREPNRHKPGVHESQRFIGHTDRVLALDLSREGRWLLSAGTDATVRLWNAATGRQIHEMRGHVGYVAAVCFSPDGKQAISGGKDQTVRQWDLATGEQVMQYTGHASVVTSVAVSRDGERFLSSSFDASVNMWDWDQPTPRAILGYRGGSQVPRVNQLSDLASLESHTSWVRSVAFSHDSTRFVSAGNEALLAIWDVATAKIVHRLIGHTKPVTRAVFLPGGRQVISASLDSSMRLWDAENGQLIRTFPGPAGPVLSLAVSPAGRRLAIASQDQSVHIWHLPDGKKLHCIAGHIAHDGAVHWAPDGCSLFSASDDHTVYRWQVPNDLQDEQVPTDQ